jgi:ketosteroid isomerase-like protein
METEKFALATQQLLDREAIRECIFRYCRGIDRQDEKALRSAYWPDASDMHGPFNGSATAFIDYALARLRSSDRSVHHVTNMSVTLAGTQAAAETYWLALQREPDAAGTLKEVFMSGRYIDRFEKRGDEWRIAARTVMYDWMRPLGTPQGTERERMGPRVPNGSNYPNDPVYALFASLVM